jgi:hypothetical protein
VEFAPSGFFCRLLVRLLHLGWKPLAFYRNGYQLSKNGKNISHTHTHASSNTAENKE